MSVILGKMMGVPSFIYGTPIVIYWALLHRKRRIDAGEGYGWIFPIATIIVPFMSLLAIPYCASKNSIDV